MLQAIEKFLLIIMSCVDYVKNLHRKIVTYVPGVLCHNTDVFRVVNAIKRTGVFVPFYFILFVGHEVNGCFSI